MHVQTILSANRSLILFIALLNACLKDACPQTPPGSTNVTRKVLVTLQAGEAIIEAESCFPLGMNNDQLYLVTTADGKYYIYENGQRTGPYTNLENIDIKSCSSNRSGNDCSAYTTETAGMDPELISMSESGQYLIKQGGKTYGPYMYIKELHVWPDKSGFVAITLDAAMKSYLVTSEGKNTALEGDAEKLHFSAVGKQYVFVVKENPNLNMDILNMDFSKMTTEEMMKFAKEQEEKAKQAGPPKAWVYVSQGSKLGPFDPQSFYTDNPTFTRTGGDNWIMVRDNALYVNGALVKKFEDTDLDICKIWLSKDGKRYAIVNWDKIVFSDGSAYPYPVKVANQESNGKIIMKWVSLENERDLVLYSREI
jgi:hypothetical protein